MAGHLDALLGLLAAKKQEVPQRRKRKAETGFNDRKTGRKALRESSGGPEKEVELTLAGKDTVYERRFHPDALDWLGPTLEDIEKDDTITDTQALDGWGEKVRWTRPRRCQGTLTTPVHDKLPTRLLPSASASSIKLQESASSLLSCLSSYSDLLLARSDRMTDETRSSIVLHFLSHVIKGRQLVLKDDAAEGESDGADDDAESARRDQGFTRPKVLVLLPFRNAAVRWVDLISKKLPLQAPGKERFEQEYGTRADEEDERYLSKPLDFREAFSGNVDDTFRLGLRLMKREVKMYTQFYSSDILIASPLGLRAIIDESESADFLASIEIMVMDQTNIILMQNWEHVLFILDHLNTIPKDPRDADFSRIKPWYIEGKASHFRQNIILSSILTLDILSAFHESINTQGRVILKHETQASLLDDFHFPNQTFQYVHDTQNPLVESDKRFEKFKSAVLPNLLKSAISARKTLLFIPSYLDFVRIQNLFRTWDPPLSYAAISEYSPVPDVSRGRMAFQQGKADWLLVTERCHFYKRVQWKGATTVVFYSPPDHPWFYEEVLRPCHEDDAERNCLLLFTQLDQVRLDGLIGTQESAHLFAKVKQGEHLFRLS